MDRLLVVGLEAGEVAELRDRLTLPLVAHETLPRVKVERGTLLAERPHALAQFLPVLRVVFHGIYEDDFDVLTALALWGGPCLPSARGMMDLRLRLPGLVRALGVSRFNALPRSFVPAGVSVEASRDTVAKWGNWHCGENKERFRGRWQAAEATLLEDFVAGEAVRVVLVGERAWQIRLAGEGWKKSIHPGDAGYMPIDPELLEDTRRLQSQFDLAVVGVDYMVADAGEKYLLEVNHIPNVTRFPEIRAAYLDLVAAWAADPSSADRS